MTEEQIKEQISIYYMSLLLSVAGHKVITPKLDHGVDLIACQTKRVQIGGVTRIIDAGKAVEMQLKCTTTNSITCFSDKKAGPCIKYDLSVKNFNDLIIRMQSNATPLILVLVILTAQKREWLDLENQEDWINFGLNIRAKAYWYKPTKNRDFSKNANSQRIIIPEVQKVDFAFCKNVFNIFEDEKFKI